MRNAERAKEVGWYQERKERRAHNRENTQRVLQEAGIEFSIHNEGAHLIVKRGTDIVVDLWPGTGRWVPRGNGRGGRGVFQMLKWLKQEEKRHGVTEPNVYSA